LGHVDHDGEVNERERVGFAYLKPSSRMFRLKLWMFSHEQYFLARNENDPSKYVILSLDEHQSPARETKTRWNQVGNGEVYRSFIRLNFSLIDEDIYLCLFPNSADAKASARSA
jgi:hypothetical protein